MRRNRDSVNYSPESKAHIKDWEWIRLNISQRNLYEVFWAYKLSYPIDYYWFWTPEDWTWSGNNQTNIDKPSWSRSSNGSSKKKPKHNFHLQHADGFLAYAGQGDVRQFLPGNWAMSCINREVGFSPSNQVLPRSAIVKNGQFHGWRWSGLILPQLWAGRMRKMLQMHLLMDAPDWSEFIGEHKY